MVDAVDHGFALGHQRCQHQRRAGPQVARDHTGATERARPRHHRLLAIHADVGAHPRHFLRVHEAVFENRLDDDRDAFRLRHESHVLRLQIGGEAGILFRGHIHRAQFAARPHAHATGGGLCHLRPGLLQFRHERAHVLRIALGHRHVTAGDGSGHHKRAGLDAVGDDGVLGAAQLLDALDANGGSARAFDFGAHLAQQFSQVHHLGLARRVAQHGFALGQHGRHHQVFGAGDGDAVEMHGGAAQPIRRDGFDVAVRLVNARAQLFQAENVQVDGPRADGAAARQRHTSPSRARHQRAQHQAGGAHGLYQLIRRFRRDDLRCLQAHHAVFDIHAGADVHQQPLHGAYVAHVRNAVQRHRLRGEQRRRQRGQRRILRTVDRDLAPQCVPAGNYEFIHAISLGTPTAPYGRGSDALSFIRLTLLRPARRLPPAAARPRYARNLSGSSRWPRQPGRRSPPVTRRHAPGSPRQPRR